MVSFQEQGRIDRRIAQKDANFWTMNASNAASQIMAALIQVGVLKVAADKMLDEFIHLRDEILESNLQAAESLQATSGDDKKSEPSNVPF